MNAAQTLGIQLPSPLQKLDNRVMSSGASHQFWIKRDDLIHPVISGNKWRKLKSIIEAWPRDSYTKIVSFGGGYSNHLHALGFVCQQLSIPFTAMVRGNYENNLTPMLKDLISWSGEIRWLSKIEYQQKQDKKWLEANIEDFRNSLVIPEGGSAASVHAGIAELVTELPEDLDYLLCPVGSGGTLAGIIQAMWKMKRKTNIVGIGVLKGQGYLEELVSSLVEDKKALTEHPWQILHDYHFGGYAKAPEELTEFCQHFTHQSQIAVEPVYSGKLFYALRDLSKQGYFPEGANICGIHTGGIQGSR